MKLDTTRPLAHSGVAPSTNQFLERPHHQIHKNMLVTGPAGLRVVNVLLINMGDIYHCSLCPGVDSESDFQYNSKRG